MATISSKTELEDGIVTNAHTAAGSTQTLLRHAVQCFVLYFFKTNGYERRSTRKSEKDSSLVQAAVMERPLLAHRVAQRVNWNSFLPSLAGAVEAALRDGYDGWKKMLSTLPTKQAMQVHRVIMEVRKMTD